MCIYSKLAPLYSQSPREVQRDGFLKALINQYGLWIGLGKRSMTIIDYACGVGALSQVRIFVFQDTTLPALFKWWYDFVLAVWVC